MGKSPALLFSVGPSNGEDAHFSIHSHVLWVSTSSCAKHGYEPKKQCNQNGLPQPHLVLGANIQIDYDSTIYLMDLSLYGWSNCYSQVIEMDHMALVWL